LAGRQKKTYFIQHNKEDGYNRAEEGIGRDGSRKEQGMDALVLIGRREYSGSQKKNSTVICIGNFKEKR
jgi:hypothetical protein